MTSNSRTPLLEKETPVREKNFKLTLTELKKFDGSIGVPLYISLGGRVLDATGSEAYGKGGRYAFFAGHDVTKCLSIMSLDPADLDDLDYIPDLVKLRSWAMKLGAKYSIVGRLVDFSVPLLPYSAFGENGKDDDAEEAIRSNNSEKAAQDNPAVNSEKAVQDNPAVNSEKAAQDNPAVNSEKAAQDNPVVSSEKAAQENPAICPMTGLSGAHCPMKSLAIDRPDVNDTPSKKRRIILDDENNEGVAA